MPRDNLFSTPQKPVTPFEFNDRVAAVFDDMIRRSVPAYDEILRRQVQLIARFHQAGTRIYDLGCSTANLGLGLCCHLPRTDFEMVAVDRSEPMIERCRARLKNVPRPERMTLICGDIRQAEIQNASVVVLNYTLQFLPQDDRLGLLRRISGGLVPGGVLLFCEKVLHDHRVLADLQQSFYHAYKRENGYSELEISQKREALEKVLVPETVENHLVRLGQAGFGPVDIWHKWFNFAAFIAIKA